METYKTLCTSEVYVIRFRLYGVRPTFKMDEPPTGVAEYEWLKQGLSYLVE